MRKITLFLVLITSLTITACSTVNQLPPDRSCDMSDTSESAECYKDLSTVKSDIRYCSGVPFYTEWCLMESDPNHAGDPEIVREMCSLITDTSTRNECMIYVEENYPL